MEDFTLDSLLGEVSSKLDTKQFALPGKSTTQALFYLLHLILGYSHCYASLFFADLRKGFDLVDHNFIIGKLRNLDVIWLLLDVLNLSSLMERGVKRNGIRFLEEIERWLTLGY